MLNIPLKKPATAGFWILSSERATGFEPADISLEG